MVTVSFEITDTTNFPSPAIPDFDDPSEVTGKFTSVYGNEDFGFTATFSVIPDDSENLQVVNVETIAQPDFVAANTISTNSVRLEKEPLETVFDEFFKYVSYDDEWNETIEILLPSEAGSEKSIIEWGQPEIKMVSDSYTFLISYVDTSTPLTVLTTSIVINQDFYWNYIQSLNTFEEEISESKY